MAMLHYPYDTAHRKRHLHASIMLTGEVSKVALRHRIRDAAMRAISEFHIPRQRFDCVLDIRIFAGLPYARFTIEAPVRIAISFDPNDFGAEPENPSEMTPLEGLRRIVENEIGRVWPMYRLDGFVEDVATISRCLQVLGRWDGKSTLAVIGAIQRLEPVVIRYHHDVDDFVRLDEAAKCTLDPSLPDSPGGLPIPDDEPFTQSPARR
jgi:hypothetical protein